MEPWVRNVRWIDAIIQLVTWGIAGYTLFFYWSRFWVGLSLAAVPWIALSLLPYLIHALVWTFVTGRSESRAAALSSLTASGLLLAMTYYFYVQLLDDGMVYFLRMMLGMALLPLSGVAVIFALLTAVLAWRSSQRRNRSRRSTEEDAARLIR